MNLVTWIFADWILNRDLAPSGREDKTAVAAVVAVLMKKHMVQVCTSCVNRTVPDVFDQHRPQMDASPPVPAAPFVVGCLLFVVFVVVDIVADALSCFVSNG